MEEQILTPWDVKGAVIDGEAIEIDYTKVMTQFGCQKITNSLIERFEKQTKQKAHTFLRRGLFYCHRDLEKILDLHEKNKLFYLYTGRGPSSESLHLGHLIPFMFCKYLQDVFNCHLVIQMTDDEKFLVKKDLTLDDVKRYTKENAKDIIACGFDPKKTFIFSNISYYSNMFETILKIQRSISYNQAKAIFGFDSKDPIGKISFPATQIAPCFSESFKHIFGEKENGPVLIPYAIDQDPYFRLARDIAPSLGFHKPASICSKFIPGLKGISSKMSASEPSTCIYGNELASGIKNKINKHAFSGGRKTLEEHREKGGNVEIDVSFQYLTYFLESDCELENIKQKYETGEMSTGELKAICIREIQRVLEEFQIKRKKVTEEDLNSFMSFKNKN